MGKYLKMADVFNACDVVETDVKVLYAVTEEYYDGVTPHDYAHHAIQYHDELVQMNKELLAALEAVARSGRGSSGRIILDSFDEQCVVNAIAKAKGGAA